MKKSNIILLTAILIVAILYSCNQQQGENKTIARSTIKRYGAVTGLKPDKIDYYKKLHAAVWPGVLKKIKECSIQNYSIYLKEIEGKPYLFSYFEYTGNNFDADMKKMSDDTTTQRWWKETAPTQVPLPDAAANNQTWSSMEQVFFME